MNEENPVSNGPNTNETNNQTATTLETPTAVEQQEAAPMQAQSFSSRPSVMGGSTPKTKTSILRKLTQKLRHPDKHVALAGSLFIVLLLVGLWAFVFHRSNSETGDVANEEQIQEIDTADALGAIVSYKEGVVEYSTSDGLWSNVTDDTKLSSGTSVRTTGAASRTIITLDDGSVIRLDANTEVNLTTLTQSRVVIAQKSGYVYNRVTESSSRSYDVETENAQFQALGTAFRTSAGGDEEAVEVFHSSVKETKNNLDAKEGEKLIVKSNVNPDKDKTIESIDIERIKNDAFIVWNRELDQKDNNFNASLGFLSDFEGPKFENVTPRSGNTIEVESGASKGVVEISGEIEPGSTMTVQEKSISGSKPKEVIVDASGKFTTGNVEGPIGSAVFELVARDRVGNKSVLTQKYTFKRKSSTQSSSINLSVSSTDGGTKYTFTWSLNGLTTPNGVKLVGGQSENPTFEGNAIAYIESGNTTTIKKSEYGAGTYFFRVCRYLSSSTSCDVYSNQVSITIE